MIALLRMIAAPVVCFHLNSFTDIDPDVVGSFLAELGCARRSEVAVTEKRTSIGLDLCRLEEEVALLNLQCQTERAELEASPMHPASGCV